MNILKRYSENLISTYVLLLLVVLRIVLLFVSQTDDADAVSRYLLALDWMKDPHWIRSAVWGPFHFYLLGEIYGTLGTDVLYGKIATLVASLLCMIPLYFFTRNFFSKPGTLFVCICWLSCPVIMRYSFMNMAELWQALFILTAMALLVQKATKYWAWTCLAGLSATIACGFRYEAWLITFLISLPLLLEKNWKAFFLFGIVAGLFPIYWLYSSYLSTGDAWYSLHASVEWNINKSGVNDLIKWDTYWARSLFFPVSVFIGGGIICGILVYKSIFLLFKNNVPNTLKFWSFPFLILLIVFIYKAYNGTLLCQHRFTISLFLLSLPFAASLIDYKTKAYHILPFLVLLSIPLSFINIFFPVSVIVVKSRTPKIFKEVFLSWPLHAEAVPYIHDNVSKEISNAIDQFGSKHHPLILDFYSWSGTYYVAEQQQAHSEEIFISSGATHVNDQKELYVFISKNPSGLLLLKAKSKLHHYLF
ncbi:MAG TPA: hypothetical protein VK766_05315, partial [Cytophagaceae bacterium]|nr:hypothetical protein [Cytophagaceae bacterium]